MTSKELEDHSKTMEEGEQQTYEDELHERRPYQDIEAEDSHMLELQQRNVQIKQKEDEQKLNFQRDRPDNASYYDTS